MRERRRLNKPPKQFHLDKRAAAIAAACEGPQDQLINSQALANWLGMSLQWVETARMNGEGPPYLRLGRNRVRYRRGAVLRWLEERQQNGKGEGR